MTTEQIKEYLSILVDMESACYIQKNTISRLKNKANSLGKQDLNIEKPHHNVAYGDYSGSILTYGFIFAGIIFVIATILTFKGTWENSGIFAIIVAPFKGALFGIVFGAIAGIIIGPIAEAIGKNNEQKEFDAEYAQQLRDYDEQKRREKEINDKELRQRQFIYSEIDKLEKQYQQTYDNLDKLYSYNIIVKDYHHDMVAVCSFYQYFNKEMTYSLNRDRETGDEGAYNIYEREKQLGIIEYKLDIVIDKLDQIMRNQSTIARQLQQANNKISSLVSGVNNMSNRLSAINSSIKEQTAIQEYNAERQISELRYMNTMDIIYRWH